MGWTVMDYRPPGESHANFFTREVLGEGQRILASAHVGGIGGTFYAAVRDARSGEVWALVVPTFGRPGATFGWKETEEAMGPAECECPPRLLDLLTPSADERVLAWRARCREHAARVAAVKPGVEVSFDVDMLTPEGPIRRFRAVDPGRARFSGPSGAVYRIGRWRHERFTVLEAA